MKKKVLGVDKDIFLLGIVSMLTDISSEAIFSVFSIFFTVVLGASTALLGIVEGLADFSASSLDYVAGFLSDKTGKRKWYSFIGYLFSTIAKSLLIIANVASAAIFRITERLGKSFRGPPRDAWIAAIAKKTNRGFSFGVHSALDKSGAVIGPLLAYLFLSLVGQSVSSFRLLFILVLIPAVLSIFVIMMIKDKPSAPVKREKIFSRSSFQNLNPEFKHFLRASAIFSLAYFSFGFLMLKAYIIGFSIKDVVLLYALFNLSFVIFAVPIGKLGDMIGRKKIIALEYTLYLLMSIGFIFAFSKVHVILLFIVFGIFFAIDDSQSKAYIVDMARSKRATAIGVYNLVIGLVYVPASIIAGILWAYNPNYAFIFAAIVSLASLMYFLFGKKR